MPIRYRSIAQADLERWYDHVGEVFARTGRQYFVNHVVNDPWAFLEGILVAEDTDAPTDDGHPLIVSTVRVFDRRLLIRGREVRIGGIGEVSTKPAYRRQGHSGRLLVMASQLMAERGMPLSLLFTDNYGHYGRYGWRQVKMTWARATPHDLTTGRTPGVGLRPVDFAADLELMMASYADFSHRLNGTVVRDSRAYWRDWVRCEIRDQGRIFLHHGQPVGFGRFPCRDQRIGLFDLGILNSHAELLPDYLHAVAAEAGMALHIPGAVRRCCRAGIDARFSVSELPPYDEQMFKLIDGTAFLRAVFHGVATTLPAGTSINLKYESGDTKVHVSDGRLAIAQAAADAAGAISLTDEQLLGLVLVGWDNLRELAIAPPQVPAAVAAELRSIFTPSDWWFWSEDGY
ncbi:MAG: GNAT family N-acetyltransferase [Chloroflexota bacterium]